MGGKVYTKIIPDSIVYSDCWRGYNVLNVSDFHHFRINHSKLFADRQNHINGIENFWNQTKRHMRKFNGVPKAQFGLYLKECEWRFNNSDPSSQLSQLRQWVRVYLN
jgi:transposase